jgi:hypothetical protein
MEVLKWNVGEIIPWTESSQLKLSQKFITCNFLSEQGLGFRFRESMVSGLPLLPRPGPPPPPPAYWWAIARGN